MSIIDELFTDFSLTNWSDPNEKYRRGGKNSYLKALATCRNCEKLIVNCQLEDTVRGFDQNGNESKRYPPLRTCMNCIDTTEYKSFILCQDCTQKDIECPGQHTESKMVPI